MKFLTICLISCGLFVIGSLSLTDFSCCTDLDEDDYAIEGGICGPIDCDDTDSTVNPGAQEGIEFGNCGNDDDDKDNDCDGYFDKEDTDCWELVNYSFPLSDTGQTICYNDSGPMEECPGEGEDYYGQDGNYLTTEMSFDDIGYRIVRDNVTGLVWQQWGETGEVVNIADYQMYPELGIRHCANLTLECPTEWRLPNIFEIMSIVDYGRPNPPAFDPVYFPHVPAWDTYFWSSSRHAITQGWIWDLNFMDGFVGFRAKNVELYIKCVCNESDTRDLVDQGDGTVTDNITGLMWQQEDEGEISWLNWLGALNYCNDLVLGECEESGETVPCDDWRLPNVREFGSIVDFRFSPAKDPIFFPNLKTGAFEPYWTSTTHQMSHETAWSVYFIDGHIMAWNKSLWTYALCVRGGLSQ